MENGLHHPGQLVGPASAERTAEGDRNLFCASYESCLDEAVRRGWNAWTCAACSIFALGPALDVLELYAQTRRAPPWPG